MNIKNENQDWNFDNAIWWLYINGYTLDAISNLIGFLKIEEAELKRDKANYKNTLKLIAFLSLIFSCLMQSYLQTNSFSSWLS